MADLDDFFAKKDRKKNKTTKKFATTEEVAKKLEDTAKKTNEKPKKEKPQDGEEGNVPEVEQDEWKEFEEEKKDYTGLKIGNLTIGQNADGIVNPAESNNENQQNDEIGQDSDKKSGPWKRVEVAAAAAAPEEPKKEVAPPAKVGTYVPPNMRFQQNRHLQPSRLKTKAAPDVHNEELFPTLAKTNDYKKNRNEGSFEVVQHNRANSHRQAEQSRISTSQGAKLQLGNRYDTLSPNS